MKLRAAITAVGLSVLFIVVYSTTNWLASLRTDVPSWYYQWELAIPLVPLMIVPYMSIDLFFVAAPFLCRDREELSCYTRRVVFAILVAGFCFTVYPLRLGFERHAVTGWLGAIFNPFMQLDRPYNLLPSLHIAFRTILVDLYARKTRGVMNLLVHVWFSLIGASTLLTHQHQVVDVIGGFALAGYSIYAFRPGASRRPFTPNHRIAVYYAVLAIASAGLIIATWRIGLVFLWPAVAATVVASGYVWLGPGVYRKTDGRLPFSTRFVLGPIVLGQYASILYYRRQCRPSDEVTPNVLIGRRLGDREARAAVDAGVTAVLDLTAEFSESRPFLDVTYCNIQVLDLTAPTREQLHEMAAFIARHAAEGRVYVHCKVGYSRSVAAVAAYLLSTGRVAKVDEAIARIRAARPPIVVRPEIDVALRNFADQLAADARQ